MRRRKKPKRKPMYSSKTPTAAPAVAETRESGLAPFTAPASTGGLCAMNTPSLSGAEVIGVVKNYRGQNTSCGSERTLHRMDGRHSKLTATSSLPQWIGPGYYADSLAKNYDAQRPSTYQVPFRNTGRVLKNADHHKAARFEQLSKSSEYSIEQDGSRPSCFVGAEGTAASCRRGHPNEAEPSDLIIDTNPWSSSSAQSTIGRPASQSGRLSPQNVLLHSPHKAMCTYESVISDFIGIPAGNQSSWSQNNIIGMDDSVNVNTVDSIVLKAADVDRRRYVNSDFAMGGLDLQEEIPVMTLSDAGNEGDASESVARSKKCHSTKGKGSLDLPKSRAHRVLSDVRRDLSVTKSSQLRDLNVSLTKNSSDLIDEWQSSQNVISHRGKSGKSNRSKVVVTPNAVNLDQLLMDDMGMSFEEAKCLVEEYSESINI